MIGARELMRLRVFYGAYFAAMGLVLPYFPVFLEGRGLDAFAIGWMTGLLSMAKIVAPPWIGGWLDRGRPETMRRFIVLASFLAAGLALAMTTATTIVPLALIVAGFGVLWAAVLPLTDGLSIGISEQRLADYGRLRLWGSVGFVLASLAGGALLVPRLDPGLPLALAGCMLLTGWAALRFPHPQPADAAGARGDGAFPPVFRRLLLVSVLMQASHGAYYGFFSLDLAAAGYDGWQIGTYWVIGVLAEIALMATASRAIQSMRPARIFTLCLGLAALRWWGLAFSLGPVWLVVMQLLHAASFAAFHLAAIAWVRRLAPAGRLAAAQGWYSASGFGLGTMLGIVACGWIVEHWGYAAAFYTCMALALAALPVAAGLRTGEPEAGRSR